jgi:hypothetical protein
MQEPVKETLPRFLSSLSAVNDELSKSWRGGASADISQQQEYANIWGRKLIEGIDASDESLLLALEWFEDSALEFSAIRSYFQKLERNETPLGAEVYARIPANKLAVVSVDQSLRDFAQELGLTKHEAADLKAYLRKRDSQRKANGR